MSLQTDIIEKIKEAMKAKDTITLEALRSVKSELLLLKTKGKDKEISEEQELKLLQKLVKQRKESAEIFTSQGRKDLCEIELAQAKVIEAFLPDQLSETEIKTTLQDIITDIGAQNIKDMGKVMGIASKKLAGKAEGKTISDIVKQLLN